MTNSISTWKDTLIAQYAHAKKTEEFAQFLGLPEGFVVRPMWSTCTPTAKGHVDWCEFGHEHDGERSLTRLKEMVTQVAAVLGPPDNCKGGAGWSPTSINLEATWTVKSPTVRFPSLEVTVRILSATGCKLDPTVPTQEAKYGKLHPECVAALAEIEEGL